MSRRMYARDACTRETHVRAARDACTRGARRMYLATHVLRETHVDACTCRATCVYMRLYIGCTCNRAVTVLLRGSVCGHQQPGGEPGGHGTGASIVARQRVHAMNMYQTWHVPPSVSLSRGGGGGGRDVLLVLEELEVTLAMVCAEPSTPLAPWNSVEMMTYLLG